MAQYGWPDVKPFLVDEYDLQGSGLTTMEISIPGFNRVTEDATGIGSTWLQHILTGEKQATGPLTFTAFYDDTASTGSDAAMQDSAAVRVLAVGYEGGTAGTRFAGGLGWMSAYERTTNKNAKHKVKGSALITSEYDDQGIILKALSTVTADGNSQSGSHDNAASSSNGGAAYLIAKSLTLGGATSLTLKAMHSTDNVTFAALATGSALTAAGAEQVVVTGTVNRYTAGLWDYGGTPNGSTTADIFIGFARR